MYKWVRLGMQAFYMASSHIQKNIKNISANTVERESFVGHYHIFIVLPECVLSKEIISNQYIELNLV